LIGINWIQNHRRRTMKNQEKKSTRWYLNREYFSLNTFNFNKTLINPRNTLFVLIIIIFLAPPLILFGSGPLGFVYLLPLFIPILTIYLLNITQFKKYTSLFFIKKKERYLFYFGIIGISQLIGFILGPILNWIYHFIYLNEKSGYYSIVLNVGFIIFNINYFIFLINKRLYKMISPNHLKTITLSIFIIIIYSILFFSPGFAWPEGPQIWEGILLIPFMGYNLFVIGFILDLLYDTSNEEYMLSNQVHLFLDGK